MTVFDALNAPEDAKEAWRRLVDLYRAAVPKEENLVEAIDVARFAASVRSTQEEVAEYRLAIVESEEGAVRADQLRARQEILVEGRRGEAAQATASWTDACKPCPRWS